MWSSISYRISEVGGITVRRNRSLYIHGDPIIQHTLSPLQEVHIFIVRT